MFQRSAAFVLLASSICVGVIGTVASTAAKSEATAISGIAKAADQRPLMDYLVRLRSLDTGRVVATTRTTGTGEYVFRALNAGRYGVEIIDPADKVVGTAGPFVVSPTGGQGHAKTITLIGAAAAGIAAIGANATSQGSAGELATAAADAGISGNGRASTRTLPSCCDN